MTKRNVIIMEMRNVDYIDIPHAILTFKKAGFAVSDIVKRPVGCRTYDLVATR